MEGMGVLLDEDWESMSRAFALEEEGLLNNWSFETPSILNNWSFETPSIYSPIDEQHTNMHYSDDLVSNFQYFCQETSNTSSGNNVFSATSTLAGNAGFSGPMEGSVGESKNYASTLADTHCSDDFSREIFRMKEETCQSKLENELGQLKRKLDIPEFVDCVQQKYDTDQKFKNPQKKARVLNNGRCKKNQKCTSNFRHDHQSVEEKKGSSRICYSSEDDCNAYQELNKGSIINSKASADLGANGKTRGSRVGATDPQSVYARRRRERINERLRILQNLIPNGTKVDISTMLEEAVHYVKFLQQQIKLLSSDELWMYAPIAFNGMDSGLHHRISSTP